MIPARYVLAILSLSLIIGAVSATEYYGLDDGYTVSLLHFNNATLADESGKVTYPQANATFNSTTKVFGGGAMQVNGASDGYLYMADSADWDMWQPGVLNNITIDTWIYPVNLPTDGTSWSPIYSQITDANTYHHFGIVGNNTFKWVMRHDGTTYEVYSKSTTTLSENTWYHIAAVRDDTRYRVYVNGFSLGDNTSADQFPYSTGVFNIGKTTIGGDRYFNGSFDEFRVSKGIARWTGNFSVPTHEYGVSQWAYSTPGTYYWVCPPGITRVYTQLTGGGGSGASADSQQLGLGGLASIPSSFSYDVTPGTNYTIVVGAGGAETAPSSSPASNDGGSSSAFGHTSSGGAGGARYATATNGNGTAGANGMIGGTGDATAGGNTSYGETGGAAGTGVGAAGGGGATHYGGSPGDPAYFGKGGKGSGGSATITVYDVFTGNIPDFVADTTTGIAGSLHHFTDLSTITDASDLTYTWDFGDGTTSAVVGDVMHVYSYTGTYDVSLTINTTTTSVTETKVSYIAITTDETELNLGGQPVPITLKVVDGYSTPLIAATVRIWYNSNSLPNTSTSWIQSLYDIDATVAAEIVNSGYVMQQNTGSDGSMTYTAFPGLGYTITVTNASVGLNHTVTIVANERDSPYIIHCPLSTQGKTNNTLAATSSTWLPWYKVNSTAYRLQVNYTDTSGATTNVRFIVMYRNGTELYNNAQAYTTGTELIDNFTVNNLPLGTELIWKYNATRLW